ncbi:MAG: cobalamin biosynthesis protein [Lachnospiraceae bacterium]|nr:cobalamin biosynthesis protein [Lachnospiraceae bacterium]
MKVDIISFTDRGEMLAGKLADELGGTTFRGGRDGSAHEWAARAFANADALIYVGAVGICVRTIAPYIRSKTADPAVVVMDETAKYVIPILSGHLGGANDLARRLARLVGAEAVITTATDRNNAFSVDAWAGIQGCAVENPKRIKSVSSKILAGREIVILSDYPIAGEVPENVKVRQRKVRLSQDLTKYADFYLFEAANENQPKLNSSEKVQVCSEESTIRLTSAENVQCKAANENQPETYLPEKDQGCSEKSMLCVTSAENVQCKAANENQPEMYLPEIDCGRNAETVDGVTIAEDEDFVADVILTIDRNDEKEDAGDKLRLVPRIVCAGIGCRRGISERAVTEAVASACREAGVSELSLYRVASIDLKKDEEGLKEFCRKRKLEFKTYTAQQLAEVPGRFITSEFVREVTGVDNVCERSAVCGAGMSSRAYFSSGDMSCERNAVCGTDMGGQVPGRLIFRKHVYDGVTVALAERAFAPDFRWQM